MKWTNCGDRTWKRKHRNPAITLEVKKWGGEYTPIVEIHGHPVFLLNQPTLALARRRAIEWADQYKPAVAEETIAESMKHWPDIHRSRRDVLDHLFFVIGNGFEWVDGAMLDSCPEAHLRPDIPPPLSPEQIAELDKFLEPAERSTAPRTRFYPVSGFSQINHVPDDVLPDWLALAHEAADLLSTDKEQGAKGAEIKAELVRRFGEAK